MKNKNKLTTYGKGQNMAAFIGYDKASRELQITSNNEELLKRNQKSFENSKLNNETLKVNDVDPKSIQTALSNTQGELHDEGIKSNINVQFNGRKIFIAVLVAATCIAGIAMIFKSLI